MWRGQDDGPMSRRNRQTVGPAPLSEVESRIYDQGERCIPGVTHNEAEWRRHLKRYEFARRLIVADIAAGAQSGARVLDLGCGVGYGSAVLAEIPDSNIVAVDVSADSVGYARTTFARKNIAFEVADATDYVRGMGAFDYIVCCEVLEHLVDPLDVVRRMKYGRRAILDVPYAEPAGRNIHHHWHNVTEEDFGEWPGAVFFYQDLRGDIFAAPRKPLLPTNLFCILSGPAAGPLPGFRLSGDGFLPCVTYSMRSARRALELLVARIIPRGLLRKVVPGAAYHRLAGLWWKIQRRGR